MNKALLLGRLGADPELKYTQAGSACLKFRMATTDRYKHSDGSWKERTEWHTVVVWGGRGESLSKMLSKGMMVFVDGRIATRTWEDRNGGKRHSTEIHCDQIVMCGGGKDGARDARPERSEAPTPESPATDLDDIGDDIPF